MHVQNHIKNGNIITICANTYSRLLRMESCGKVLCDGKVKHMAGGDCQFKVIDSESAFSSMSKLKRAAKTFRLQCVAYPQFYLAIFQDHFGCTVSFLTCDQWPTY